MRVKLLSIFAALLLVAACSSTPEDDGSMAGDGGASLSNGAGDGSDVRSGDLGGGPQPGSQTDLVENVGDRVFFEFDSSSVTSEGRRTLDRQAEWLRRHGDVTITIEGHADERGTREYNLGLGERRATAAKNYLVAQGISENRIAIISFGKERPANPASNEQAWAENRRAVTIVDRAPVS